MRKIHLMPRNFRRSTGGSFYILNDAAGDAALGFEVYAPGTTHVVAEHRTGIGREAFEALRQDARINRRTFKTTAHTAQDHLATQKPRPARSPLRELENTKVTNPLLERVV